MVLVPVELVPLANALDAAAMQILAGERRGPSLVAPARAELVAEPGIEVEYVELRDAYTLEPLDSLAPVSLLALAASVGSTRLIDNITITLEGDGASVDLGVRSA